MYDLGKKVTYYSKGGYTYEFKRIRLYVTTFVLIGAINWD